MKIKGQFAQITGADPDDVDAAEARNGVIHVISLTLTKTADALIDPKLVLSWLLTALGAPGAMIGLLVPIREAGALLPQLALARFVEASSQRKRFWSAGSAAQGVASLGIAVSALLFTGFLAGSLIIAFLSLLSVARSASSVSYKDALARTIKKRRRGAITGLAMFEISGLFGTETQGDADGLPRQGRRNILINVVDEQLPLSIQNYQEQVFGISVGPDKTIITRSSTSTTGSRTTCRR